MPCICWRVQGFYFVQMQYSPIQAFTARFVQSMQLYSPRRKAAHRALQGFFRLFAAFYRYYYICVYPAIPHHLRHAGAHTRARTPCSAYQIPPPRRTLYRSAHPPYYNKVYKGRGAPGVDPCRTVQHIVDHASPAACDLAPVNGQGAPGQSGTLHPAGQSSSMGAAGGAELLAACAASLFRAFAR